MTGWPFRAGGEMFSSVEMTQYTVDFADTFRVNPQTVVMTPWGYAPLCMPPIGDPSGTGRLHPGMDIVLCTHPVFWLENDTRRPLPGEHPWEWVLRVYLELRARQLVDASGAWVDVLSDVLDVSKPENRTRLETYRDGKFDPLLSKFFVARSDDLRFDEARLAAREMFEAHQAQHTWFLTVERDEARLRAETDRTWLSHAPSYWALALNEWRERGAELLTVAQRSQTPQDEVLVARKRFSEAVGTTRDVLKGVVDHLRGVQAAVSANTRSWETHQSDMTAAIRDGIDEWESLYDQIEVAAAGIYARLNDPDGYKNLDDVFESWWQHLWAESTEATTQIDHLISDGRLYPPPERRHDELEIVVGRERFRHIELPPLPSDESVSLN